MENLYDLILIFTLLCLKAALMEMVDSFTIAKEEEPQGF
jgi:hypothetical protein